MIVTEEVEVEVVTQKDNTMLIVIVAVVALVLICAFNLIFCQVCVRKYKKQVNSMEVELKSDPTKSPRSSWNRKSKRNLVMVGDGVPDDFSSEGDHDDEEYGVVSSHGNIRFGESSR